MHATQDLLRSMGVIRGVEKELGLKHFGDFGLPASPSAFSSMGPSHPSFSRSLSEVVARWRASVCDTTYARTDLRCATAKTAHRCFEICRNHEEAKRMDLAVVLALRLWHAKDGEFCP